MQCWCGSPLRGQLGAEVLAEAAEVVTVVDLAETVMAETVMAETVADQMADQDLAEQAVLEDLEDRVAVLEQQVLHLMAQVELEK